MGQAVLLREEVMKGLSFPHLDNTESRHSLHFIKFTDTSFNDTGFLFSTTVDSTRNVIACNCV